MTGIESDAFWNCVSLENVKIGNSVAFIGSYAFSGDFGNCLKNITRPENVETVGNRAFLNCNVLTNIRICNPETIIDKMTFGYTTIEPFFGNEIYLIMLKEACMYSIIHEINGTEFDEEEKAFIDKFLSSFNMIEEGKIVADAVIYGCTGSTAEAYANENKLTFAEIGQIIPPVEEEPEDPEIPDVPEIPEQPDENKPENDFFGMIREFFERIVNLFEKIFETLKNLFA